MSIAAKLIVYNYYAQYNAVHKKYGESYNYYRIVQEYLTEAYVDGMSCIERDVNTLRNLKTGKCGFDDAVKIIDSQECIANLSRWYVSGKMEGMHSTVCAVLNQIDAILSVEARAQVGQHIWSLNDFENKINPDMLNCLQIILGRFEHFVRNGQLMRIANVFNPNFENVVGWWYNKFCVTTYVYRMLRDDDEILKSRLTKVVKQYVHLRDGFYVDEMYNCPRIINELYVRFCGIGKQHFNRHKTSCMYILFQYLRNETTQNEKDFICYRIIESFGKQCIDIYRDLKNLFDMLHVHAICDVDKNALMDLLCVDNEEIDVDCFYYVFESFLRK
ncbi:hypothetical protein [Palpita vitrealis nucleopolyhedrovirus]|uniref:Ac11 n=1 Tax=Palpita vitrealis nucleopolyhedrovirus TaxID=2951960 RepID=A0AAE9LN78_9ABAC|nr:hypothetical protein [Palpita vitrealis nucleopolyhedrovirus]